MGAAMPWNETNAMDERKAFIRDWLRHRDVSGLSRTYGISRVTAHKWIARFRTDGEAGLADQPRRPHHSPQATRDDVRLAIIDLRKEHSTWGPKKVVAALRRNRPDLDIPAASTAGGILRRAGLVEPRQRRRGRMPSPVPGGRGTMPNDVWCVDYKGEFRTGNGRYCYPLTVTDEFSRYLLECRAFERISGEDARRSFERLFRTHGLPSRIRSDNGAPFAGQGVARLSRLSVWWVRLGIALERNQPRHPEQNGCHERMHRDLKAHTTRPPEANTSTQQRRFDHFCHHHNDVRPHEALEMATPASRYQPSSRAMPDRLPPMIYPGHYETRRVCAAGGISLRGQAFFVSEALAGEEVGLVEEDEGQWAVRFANLRLGTYDNRTRRFATVGRPQPATQADVRSECP